MSTISKNQESIYREDRDPIKPIGKIAKIMKRSRNNSESEFIQERAFYTIFNTVLDRELKYSKNNLGKEIYKLKYHSANKFLTILEKLEANDFKKYGYKEFKLFRSNKKILHRGRVVLAVDDLLSLEYVREGTMFGDLYIVRAVKSPELSFSLCKDEIKPI